MSRLVLDLVDALIVLTLASLSSLPLLPLAVLPSDRLDLIELLRRSGSSHRDYFQVGVVLETSRIQRLVLVVA